MNSLLDQCHLMQVIDIFRCVNLLTPLMHKKYSHYRVLHVGLFHSFTLLYLEKMRHLMNDNEALHSFIIFPSIANSFTSAKEKIVSELIWKDVIYSKNTNYRCMGEF